MIKRINSNKRMIGWLKDRILNELLSIIFNPSHFLVWIYIFRWHNIKDEGICDPWRKFEFKKSYIFKDIDLWIFWIFSDFILIFTNFNSFKICKNEVYFSTEPAELTWHGVGPGGCDMACKTTWQRHADTRERLRGVDVARTRGRVTRAHADA